MTVINNKLKILLSLSICFVIFSCSSKTNNDSYQTKSESSEPLNMATNAAFSLKNDGKAIFKKLNCQACHMKNANIVGPSLRKIRKAYKNQEKELLQFLIGEGKPKIDPDEYSKMKPNIEAFQKLGKEEQQKLIDFLMDK